jgi:hypothetical protein
MTFSAVTFDTCWLMEFAEAEKQNDYGKLNILVRAVEKFRKKGIIFLYDQKGCISREYERYFPSQTYIRGILTIIDKTLKVEYMPAEPSDKCTAYLDREVFDLSDRVFVAIAEPFSGAYLTSETKHLETKRTNEVRAHCNVSIIGTHALEAWIKK